MRNKKKIIRAVTVPLSIEFFEEIIEKMRTDGYECVVVTSPGKELDEFRSVHPAFKTIEVPMERHISLIKDLKSLILMVKTFSREKPYIVHSMTPKAGLICMMAAWLTRVPVRIHTFTGLVWPTATGMKRRILMLTDKILCACATHIIPEGEGVMNDLQTFITKKPMKVLGYGNCKGIDLSYWRITPELRERSLELRDNWWLGNHKPNERMFTFLFVGRIVGDKGINELVEAFLKLREHYLEMDNGQKVRLILVGRYEKELDAVSDLTQNRIDSTPSIMAVGPKYGDELTAYYAASDCFVFPSYREGFPNTVLEAGAMGLPQIVTDINGSREIITGNEAGFISDDSKLSLRDNGIVIPSKDVDSLYKAMEMMVSDGGMRKIMAGNARRMIEKRFEKSFVQGCQIQFYKEILK